MKISIVIPNYNGKDLLEKNLQSIETARKYAGNQILEVIIVDDASSDDSVIFIKKNYPGFKIIRHRVNRGFSASVNTGVRSSHGELIALINTDVTPESDFLKHTLLHFEDPNLFAVSFHEKGYGFANGAFINGFIVHRPGNEAKTTKETFWANGGSMVVRRDVWLKLGGMDESLLSPFYWEDIDLSYRAQKRGYKVLWEPKAKVVHEHESTMTKLNQKYRQRIQERNQLLFIWKNLTSPRLFGKHIIGLFKRTIKSPGYILIIFLSVLRLPKVYKARKREKKEGKVSDEAIFERFNK